MKPKEDIPSSEQDAALQAAIPHPNSAEATSAPEVPAHVAKQFGLPHTPAVKEAGLVPDVATEPLTPTPPAQTTDKEANPLVDNPDTEAAVDDILNKESDELLGIQDDSAASREKVSRGGSKLKRFFRAWWRKKWARYSTILIIIAALVAVAVIPKARYAVLNTFGVRSSASVVVLDNTTQLPLKNVTVSLGSAKTQTNKDGVATLKDLKLGDYQFQVQRLAFAPYKQSITIGWGSNPLGNVKLTAVGLQYHIQVKDYLSGKPIAGAEAESSALNALSDAKGNIVLTLDDTSTTTLDITLHANGYRTENATLDAATKADISVQLVPDQKAVFVTKQSGKYDVYSSDLDGKNRKLLLAGTGNENNTVSLVVSPDNTQAALVSTRDNIRDADGYLLYALTFINVNEGTSTVVDHAQQIQLVDWIGNRLIYRSTTAGASAANPQRNRLLAYNYGSNSRVQLATANQFNTIVSAEGYIYYGVSSTDPNALLGLFRVKPDGSARERLSSQEVWTCLRAAYNTFSVQTPTGWNSYDLSAKKFAQSSAPGNFISFFFADDSKDSRTIWTDTRDGKGALLLKKTSDDKITTLATQPGLGYPVRWASDSVIIYRVVTSTESADYAVSPDGGTPRKISDVSATFGFTQVD